MPLVNGRILLDRIQEKRVLAGAFNTTNLETTISILNAIERSGLPNFIQIAPTNAQLSGYDYIYEIVKRHADKMDVPVSLHLDHGKTQEDVKQAVQHLILKSQVRTQFPFPSEGDSPFILNIDIT